MVGIFLRAHELSRTLDPDLFLGKGHGVDAFQATQRVYAVSHIFFEPERQTLRPDSPKLCFVRSSRFFELSKQSDSGFFTAA